jgi:hypothetical protein
MAEKRTAGASDTQQTMEQLQKRYQSLHTRKIQADTNLENAQKQLAQLKKEALERYKTDDLNELKQLLATMKRENEEKRAAYQADLDRIESELEAVEAKFNAGDAGEEVA